MGTETPLRIPTINFSDLEDLKPGSPRWESVKAQVLQALEDYGCFEALFTKIPLDLRKSMISSLQELFDLPLETKLRNVSEKPYHGYFGQEPMVPLFESMGIDDAPIPGKAEAFVDLLWPGGNPNLCKTIKSFSEQLSELDRITRRMVLESLGVEKYVDEHMESTNYLLRLVKYKGPQTNEPKLGLHSHTDKNTLTILYQNEVDGLEVQTKDGDQWISVKLSSPASFIVMLADSFYAWTNGSLHSARHRVVMRGNEARYSVGLFSVPKAGYMVKAPDELVDEDHPLLFRPFDHVEFLKFYFSEAGRKAQSALKTYCGV